MAYRIKGLYTKKERAVLGEVVRSYLALIRSPEVDAKIKQLFEAVSLPLVVMAVYALYLDDCKIFEKACGNLRP